MDLLKAGIYILVVMMGINAASMMLTHVGITNNTAYNSTEIQGAFNATVIVDSWGWDDNPFYDIGTGLVSFWYRTVPVVEAFPHMCLVYGVDEFIYAPLHDIWRFIWIGAVALGIIAGRQT